MTYTTGTITGTFKNVDGTASQGAVVIAATSPEILDATGNVILNASVRVVLDVAGSFSIVLPATDDVNLNPTGFGYTVTPNLYAASLPAISLALPAGTTVDLADVTSVDPSTFTPTATYASLAALTAEAATRAAADTTLMTTKASDLPDVTVAGTSAQLAVGYTSNVAANGVYTSPALAVSVGTPPLRWAIKANSSAGCTITYPGTTGTSTTVTLLAGEALTFRQKTTLGWGAESGNKPLSELDTRHGHSGNGAALAFGGIIATLKRGQRSVCLAMLGDSTGDGKEVGTGNPVSEWTQVFTQKLAADYPGYTLLERQWNDTNQSYDQPLTRQTGTINSGTARCAIFTVGAPGALQYTGTAITGDIDIRIKVAPADWTPSGDQTLAARWDAAGGRSWLLVLKANGTLGWNWSTTGASGVGEKVSTTGVQTASGVADGSPLWVRVTFDVDNGAAGNDLKFYYGSDGTAWTQLGTTVTTATATSIFAGTSAYQIGSFTSGFSNPFAGKVHWVEVHSGLVAAGVNGASVVPPLPDDWDYQSGETTVSFGGAPVFMFLNGSQSGQNVAYFDNTTRRAVVHQPHGQSAIMINTGHNDVTQSRQLWITNYGTMVTNIKALAPGVPVLAFAQNPTGVGGSFSITAQGVELRAARGAILQQWAASQAGVYGFDAWPLLTSADTIDQLHPTTGAGSGAEKWGLGLYKAVVA